jgi:O-antigen/teichoic acid export membrane protein
MIKKLYYRIIRKNIGPEYIYIISDILVKALGFLTLPLFIKYMSPSEYGQFNIYLSYKNILVIFIGLNVSNSIVRYFVDNTRDKKYLATAIWIVLLTGSIVISLAIFFQSFFRFIDFEIRIIVTILLTAVFTAILNICREILRSEKNHILYGLTSFSHALITTVFGLLLVIKFDSDLAYWRIVAILATTILFALTLTARVFIRDGFIGKLSTAKYMLAYSLPLIPYALSTTIMTQINKMLLNTVSLAEVGIFSFATNLAIILYIISIAINRSFQPTFFESLRDNVDYKPEMKRNIRVFIIIFIVFLFLSDFLVLIFSDQDYQKAVNIVPILMIGYAYFFIYTLYVNFIYYNKKTHYISTFSIVSALIAILLNLILIKYLGYIGAAIATSGSYFSLYLMAKYYVEKKLYYRVLTKTEKFSIFSILWIATIIKISITYLI